ncbi:hypothetical protein CHARACLAT_015752 [Characodon lateralis]|uniref:Uncharacterized protein n=1 Tax=Characodon lateralis TaxID=208331 RepID=A0ABU7D720_9TELE|nr:hypothetical protein [Characodon lateralis]
MLTSVLLLLLLAISSSHAAFYGVLRTYSSKDLQGGGYPTVVRHIYTFTTCEEVDQLTCGSNCSDPGIIYNKIEEISGEWCQKERILIWVNQAYQRSQSRSLAGNWTYNLNGIVASLITTQDEERVRSDTNKPNTSPQTTIISVVRVPSNCPRNISLLAFDPDGDEVRCRFAENTLSECTDCTQPPVLSLSSSCTLSFNSTNSNSEGPYAVQLIMEDLAEQTISVTQPDGGQAVISAGAIISKIPVQFVFRVDPAAPSCTEGLYLPRFLPPTPENRAHISATINQTLEISIRAEATQSVITNLVFSGPYTVIRSTSGSGNFTLRWKPTDFEGGLSHPICFVVQANFSSSVYNSDLRCIVVTVSNYSVPAESTAIVITTPTPIQTPATHSPATAIMAPTTAVTQPPTSSAATTTIALTDSTPDPRPHYVIALDAMISTTLTLEDNKDTIMQLLKEKLIQHGLTSTISLRLLSSSLMAAITTAAP